MAADTAGLGFGEVDVIFPRNGTFGPMTLTPIVFAFQNPAAINRLYPYITYGLWPADLPNGNQTLSNDLVEAHLPNISGPVSFLQASIANTLNTENEWEFVWKMDWTNCSTPANGTTSDNERRLVEKPDVTLMNYWAGRSIHFTTKKGANQPNFTALTTGDKCSDTSALAFNVTKTLRAQTGYYEGEMCAVLQSPAPTAAPCKIIIAPAAASSISSTLTAGQCIAATPAISCPARNGGAYIDEVTSQLKWWAAGVLLVGKFLI